ncbi:lysophospholipid acyltransferase family protein [Arcicella sp. LKC2W]|uniref:lysophospholipid acyltransferase family protein n=1 Tax=Arcicella sp. LKC2W TaxID=2984198 RepID=UPI002B20AFBC|nr:lysophospholipid acyltransferase family protein [Arcicella sp. LKC2W]MEA5458962.1 lysophospholipid acyltransferase family protein [Arcicella sp. LKC2W]
MMKNTFTLCYTVWSAFCVFTLFLLLFPLMFLFVQREEWRVYYLRVNTLWCKAFFYLVGIKNEADIRFKEDFKQPYIYCSNHFSTLDNFTFHLCVKNRLAIIGDAKIGELPLFGYLFRKMHICIDRKNQASKNKGMFSAAKLLKKGISIGFAPEGGIRSFEPPKIHQPFQDGAFILAIRFQVPILPISNLSNHLILPEKNPFRLHRYPFRAILHPPIETKGMTINDLEKLKKMTFDVIQNALLAEANTIQ